MNEPQFGGMTWRGWASLAAFLSFCAILVLVVGLGFGQSWPPATTYMTQAQIEALTTLCAKPNPIPNEPLPKKDHEDSFVPCMELRMFYKAWCEE